MLGLVAAALAAAQAPPGAAEEDGRYECWVLNGEDGGTMLYTQFFGDGTEALTSGTWSGPEGAGRASLAIRWQFMLGDARPHRAYVTIAVSLRQKARGTRLLTLARDDAASRGQMTLGSSVTPISGGRQAMATVDLQTLLDYSGGKEDLTWALVRPGPYRGSIDSGWLQLARVREAVKRLEPLLGQLSAKRADFRNLCSWSAGRPEED